MPAVTRSEIQVSSGVHQPVSSDLINEPSDSLTDDLTDSSSLRVAQELTNRGKIEQAVMMCDRYLAKHPTTAGAYLLRGELYQCMDNNAAAEICYERAVYLDP